MKTYVYDCMYRQQQITKEVCAKNANVAAEKLEINPYEVRKYCRVTITGEIFDGVVAYFDSGILWRERPDLIRVKMPFEKLKDIIDTYFYHMINKDNI